MLAGSLSFASPASAGVPQAYVTVSKPYFKNWVFRSAPLSACMLVQVSGSVTGTRRYAYYSGSGGWDPNYYVWSRVKMANPRITMTTGTITSIGCDFTRPVAFRHASLRQDWFERGCKMRVGISAGFPWAVQATPTYSCGTYNVATRATDYNSAASRYEQYNSGSPVYYRGEKLALATDAIPFGANVRVTGYRTVGGSARSDTFSSSKAVAYLKRLRAAL